MELQYNNNFDSNEYEKKYKFSIIIDIKNLRIQPNFIELLDDLNKIKCDNCLQFYDMGEHHEWQFNYQDDMIDAKNEIIYLFSNKYPKFEYELKY